MIAAIDPGLRGCGVALFSEVTGRLQEARYVRGSILSSDPTASGAYAAGITARYVVDNLTVLLRGRMLTRLLLEMPQIYVHRKGKDPNDLLGLAAVLGGICALHPYSAVTQYRPHDWKGNLDGDAMVERIQKRAAEAGETNYAILPSAKSLHHNVWDAVGIGYHFFGRLEKRRVIAR